MENTKFNKTHTVGEIVAEDYRKAAVFKNHNIDFCCGGGQSLEQACITANLDLENLIESLELVEKQSNDPGKDFQSWPLDKLVNYIIDVHHEYVKNNVSVILEFVNKVKNVHGDRKPNVSDIADHFNNLAQELEHHMRKEEMILFPYIIDLVNCKNNKRGFSGSNFGTIRNPINLMLSEHQDAGTELDIIRKLTDDFKPPYDACATHTVSYGQLKDFETDLLQHIHLENNILFPKAISLEEELLLMK